MIQKTINTKLDHVNKKYGFYSKSGQYLVVASFDPWNGEQIKSSYQSDYLYAKTRYFDMLELPDPGKKIIDLTIEKMHTEDREQHILGSVCPGLKDIVDGSEFGTTRASYFPNIRTYAILNKKECGGFDPMDYCPFCGAKLPEKLDEKLTEILQKEYGLNSWKDYEKAPSEFQTDEWWIKRGL